MATIPKFVVPVTWWRITDEDGRKHIINAPSKSAAITWCKRVLESSCCGCRPAKEHEIPKI